MCLWAVGVIALGLAGPLGCEALVSSAEDQIADEVKKTIIGDGSNVPGGQAGQGDLPDTPEETELAPTIEITNMTPSLGETTGGTLIEIIGFGFEADMVVQFGPQAVLADPAFVQIQPTRIVCRTPAYAEAGPVAVRVRNSSVLAVLPNGFSYFEPVEVVSVTPATGPSSGGTEVVIVGKGFIDNNQVQFGSGGTVDGVTIDSNTLTAVTPTRAAGTYSVTVANSNGGFGLAGAFTFYDPVTITQLNPFAGPIGGGTDVTVTGTGLIDPTTSLIDSSSVTNQPGIDATSLTLTTPPSPSGAEGAVTVQVANVNGDYEKNNSFVFFDPSVTDPRIVAVSPSTGLISGGRDVHIVAVGLASSGTKVYFGGDEATDCTQHDDYTITCPAPEAAEGSVDVQVVSGTFDVTATDAFKYIDLQLTTALPNTGSQAGGTFVEVHGKGFGQDAVVHFGDAQAKDVLVQSDGKKLTCRTPPGIVGSTSVRVNTQDVEVEAQDFFTYVDPFPGDGWVSGDPVDGSINIRVLADNSDPLQGAFVVVGAQTDPNTAHLYGFTDARGEITISGPEIVGPQDIHGAKQGYGGFTFIDMNRENVTLMLIAEPEPPPDPLPPCPEGEPSAPPLIEGNVFRIKDEFNTGNDTVVVTTSYQSFNEPLPDAGPNSIMVSQGGFELVSRTGDLIVIALAGQVTIDGTLNVHAMGFHPFLKTEASSAALCFSDDDCTVEGEQCISAKRLSAEAEDVDICIRVYDGVDVTIDTPLNQEMVINLVEPPFARPSDPPNSAPNKGSAFIWYDFGYQGLHPMHNLTTGVTNALFADMPKSLPSSLEGATFGVSLGLYVDFFGQSYPPYSEVQFDGLIDTKTTIVMSPILKTQDVTAEGTGSVSGPLHFGFDTRPEDIPDTPASGSLHYMYDVNYVVPCEGAFPMPQTPIRWLTLTPGTVREFDLPIFPETAMNANMPDGTHGWQLETFYSPGASYDNFDLGELMNWRSHAMTSSQFTTHTFAP
jgi:hypothetical protein